MKKLLLIGGYGFIGTYFLEKYAKKYEIKVIDTNFFGFENKNNIEFIKKDIRHIEKIDLENVDIIVHMGELSNDPLGDLNKKITNEINHNGTKKLLKHANNTKVRKFIYMSSASVYGFSREIMDEESKVNPLTEYSKAKVNNENFILNNEFTFETIILRNSTAFGFSKNLRLDLVVNDLTYLGFFENKINLLSDGTPKRPIVHIADICKAIDLIINHDDSLDKEIFNIGDNSMNFSIRQIAEVVANLLKIEDIKFGEKDSDQRSYELSFKKLNKYFQSFEIEFTLEEGVKDLIHNFKTYKFSGNERRIKVLNNLINENKLSNELIWR